MSQAPLNITPDVALSGSEFRAAVNAALQALASQSSGTQEPSATYPFQFWADTTNNKLKMRNVNNDAWVIVGNINDGAVSLIGSLSYPIDTTGEETVIRTDENGKLDTSLTGLDADGNVDLNKIPMDLGVPLLSGDLKDGHEGSFSSVSNLELTGVHYFSNFALNSGHTLSPVKEGFDASDLTPEQTLIIFCTGTATIAGVIDYDYCGAKGGESNSVEPKDGEAGYYGGGGGSGSSNSSSDYGGTGGTSYYFDSIAPLTERRAYMLPQTASYSNPLDGSAASAPTDNDVTGALRQASLNNYTGIKLFGAGGGTAGRPDVLPYEEGGNGGGGVVIIANEIAFTGTIYARGSQGGAYYSGNGGGGGGGVVVMACNTFTTDTGTIDVSGGAKQTDGNDSASGLDGLVYKKTF